MNLLPVGLLIQCMKNNGGDNSSSSEAFSNISP